MSYFQSVNAPRVQSALAAQGTIWATFWGDSITVGVQNGGAGAGAAVLLSSSPGYRGHFFRAIRATRGDVRAVGTYHDGPIHGGNTAGSAAIGSPWLFATGADYWHNGVSGNTIAQVTARIAAEAAALPHVPHVAFFLVGTNQGGRTAPQQLSDLTDLHAAARAAMPSTRFVFCTIPQVLAAGEATRVAYNAGMAAQVAAWGDPLAECLDTCSDFDQRHQSWVAGARDGHPSIDGYRLIGERMADRISQLYPVPTGLTYPRAMALRQSQASVSIVGVLDGVKTGNFTIGSNPFALAFNVVPVGAFAGAYGTLAAIGGIGQSYAAPGLALVSVSTGDTTTANLSVYHTSGGPKFGVQTILRQNRRARIVIAGHASGDWTLWVDGSIAYRLAAQSWNFGAQPIIFGPTSGVNAHPIYVDNIELAIGSSVPSVEDMRAAAEANYFDGSAIPGGVGAFRCMEGVGNALTDAITPASTGNLGAFADNNGGAFTAGGGTATWATAASTVWPYQPTEW